MFSVVGPEILSTRNESDWKDKSIQILKKLNDTSLVDSDCASDEDDSTCVNKTAPHTGSFLIPKPVPVCGAFCYISVISKKTP